MSYCILSVAYRYCPPVGSLENSWIRTGLWIRILKPYLDPSPQDFCSCYKKI